MTPLANKLQQQILQYGPISFADYMAACLFDPEFGYYTNLTAIGRSGDFTTAPECGPYFARAIAHFLQDKLSSFKQPVIVELGGGTGQLAFDVLSELQLPLRYVILEKSPSLRAMQQQKLQQFTTVEWVEDLQEGDLQGVILANEFFDALPVERFIQTAANQARQLGVAWSETQGFYEAELAQPLFIPAVTEIEQDERFEVCLGVAKTLSPILNAFSQGLALVIDYGAERLYRSTLSAYHQHQIVSVFDAPGECDVTAHVDFTGLAEVFVAEGWQIQFLKPQNQFLLEQGILPETGIGAKDYALKRLLDPRLMGLLFKVLCCVKSVI